jgi:type I restriction enzyme, S subunit
MSLLEQHFDVAFAAPDGIKKLRELILTLAMQGKLVPQDPKDEPASELLRSIELEKQRLLRERKIGKFDPSSIESTQEELPYTLPKKWKLTILEQLVLKIGSGSTPRGGKDAYTTEGIPFLRSQNIWNHGLRTDGAAFISEETHKKMAATTVRAMDILLNITGASIGRCALVSDDFQEANVSQHVTIIRFVEPEIRRFIHFFFLSPYGQSMIWTRQVGMSREGLSKKVLEQFPIPLPPLAEQRRIVAKIDQLMARCDELEKLRIDRSQRLLTVHTAALDRLLTAKDSSEFSTAWSFITQHFGELYSVKENVVELRKTILQLAVMGKLVRQDPNDEPASELLRSIELEKQRLVKEGKIKQSKPLPEIKPEEMPYELPKGWEWIRLGDTISRMDAGWSPACDEIPAAINEWGVLKTTSVQPLCFLPHQNKALPKKLDPRPEAEVKEGDMLITRAGPKNRVGICCVVKFVRPYLMLSDKIIRFRIFGDLISSDYCILCLYSGYGSVQIESMKSGMAESQVNISQEKLKQVVISLPPLAEQRLIVEKIDRLMGMCDRLEGSIESAKGKQTDLLNALMSQV